MVSFLAEVKIFRFWPKTMDCIYVVRRFGQISFRTDNFSLEGATKLTIVVLLSLYRAEQQIVKCRFVDWEDVLSVDFTRTPEMLEKREAELVRGGGW